MLCLIKFVQTVNYLTELIDFVGMKVEDAKSV